MSYYRILGLEREPFSTSPDPEFFFLSREHKAAFFRLQVAIELRRGLSVVLGDVGTGKTTLSRKLARALADKPEVEFHLILNPWFKSEEQFLRYLARLFHASVPAAADNFALMEAVEHSLFERGVEAGRTVVLLMDEAQILPDFVLEVLRILLNYETNNYKILQLVLVGQLELLPRIRAIPNFWDRIAMKFVIHPFGEEEVRAAVEYRLKMAGYRGAKPLFTDEAIRLIARHTRGYPRKLAFFCHTTLERLVMYDKNVVDVAIVEAVMQEEEIG